MRRRRFIAVVGSGELAPSDPRWSVAEQMGRALVDEGYGVICGGKGGVMEAVAIGARSSERYTEGCIVGILSGGKPEDANPFIDVALATHLGAIRNTLVASAEGLIAIGGGAGTLSEMAFAWIFDRPVIAFRVDGWSGRLADSPLDERVRFVDRTDDRVIGVDHAAEAIEVLDHWFK